MANDLMDEAVEVTERLSSEAQASSARGAEPDSRVDSARPAAGAEMSRPYSIGAPTLRQRAVATLTRLYPFLSGCGTIANSGLVRALAPDCDSIVWAPARGGLVLVPLDDYVGRAAFYVGELDRKVATVCARLVRPGDTVIDVGANLGTMTVLFAHLVGPSGRVLAFEPNPRVLGLLQRSAASLPEVEIYPVALGAKEATLELAIPRRNSGAASLVHCPDSETRVPVPVVRLSRILRDRRVGRIRLVKIDAEGYEPEVLRGAQEAFAHEPPDAILFEVNGETGHTDHPTFCALSVLDYVFFAIRKTLVRLRLDRWQPGTPLPPSHDFLALHRGPSFGEMVRALGVKASFQ
jgi:FkbM family methyltransferase